MISPTVVESAPINTASKPTRQQRMVVLSFAVGLTLVVLVSTCLIQNRYVAHYPYFFDPVGYQYRFASVYTDLVAHGPFAAFINECVNNEKYPLRTIPLVLLAPQLLTHPFGHVATSIPFLFAFLLMFGWTILERSRNAFYAVAGMVVFCALPGLYNPAYGIGALWLDSTASFLVGCCALSVINFVATKNERWLISFSIFLSLAAFSRYICIVYAIIVAYPILVIALYADRAHLKSHELRRSIVILFGLPAVLCGPYLIFHAPETYRYYSTFGYALHQPIAASVASMTAFTLEFLAPGYYFALLLCGLLLNLFLWAREKGRSPALLAALVWMAFSFLAFLFLVLRSSQNGYVMWYSLPLLTMLALIPYTKKQPRGSVLMGAGIVYILVASTAACLSINQAYRIAKRPSDEKRLLKELDNSLADFVTSSGSNVVWCAFFDEYAWMPTMEAFYRTKQLARVRKRLFSVHDAYWKGWYPTLNSDQIAQLVLAQSEKDLNLAVVLADPSAAYSSKWLDNPTSRLVAFEMAEHLKHSSNWRRIGSIDSEQFGRLTAYENLLLKR